MILHRGSAAARLVNIVLAVLLCPVSAWAWGNDGHKIVTVIAADNLTPAARSYVANILGVPTDQLMAAIEAASIRPDSELRKTMAARDQMIREVSTRA